MKKPNVNAANKYARDIVAGTIPACRWIVLACQRHLDDLRKSKDKANPFYFDGDAAERVCMFVQMFPHTKGKWAAKGLLLELQPWQLFCLICLFGWKRKKDNLRRFRKALLLIPRKNGKSALAAAIGLYMLAGDGEHGAEVFSGASSEKQAWEVFKPAQIMASKNEDFKEYFGVQVNASNLAVLENGSKFEPVIGKPGDGSSPSCAIADEVHEHKTSELIDTMETGMGAREQPLLLMVTTAGSNLAGPCYAYQIEAQKMLEGTIQDDQLFCMIYTVDPADDWTAPESLIKANPNYGVSVSDDFLLSQLQAAKNSPRKQSAFKTKHLNVWVGAMDAYFNMERWRESGDTGLKLTDFAGKPCYIGLDLASRVDIAAIEILFPLGDDDYVRFGKYYLPDASVDNGAGEHYRAWADQGIITLTDGDMIDFAEIKADIIEIATMFDVRELAFDPFQATMLITELMKEGLPVVEVRQTVLNFSEPMKAVDGLIRSRRIRHDGDPCQSWMLSNVVAKTDAKDNVYPRKDTAENKIDGAVALIMAMSRCIIGEDQSLDDAINGMISATI